MSARLLPTARHLGPFVELALLLALGRVLRGLLSPWCAEPWWLAALPDAVLLPVGALLVAAARGQGPRELGLLRPPSREAMGMGLAFVAAALSVSLLGFLALPAVPVHLARVYGLADGGAFRTLLLIVVPLHAALGEELRYRAYLQSSLARAHPAWGPLLAALAFASAHAFQGLVPLLLFHLPGALALTALYRSSRSLPLLVGVHLLFDELVFLALRLVLAEPELGRLALVGLLLGSLAVLGACGAGARRLGGEMRALVVGLGTEPGPPLLAAVFVGPLLWVALRAPLGLALLAASVAAAATFAFARRTQQPH